MRHLKIDGNFKFHQQVRVKIKEKDACIRSNSKIQCKIRKLTSLLNGPCYFGRTLNFKNTMLHLPPSRIEISQVALEENLEKFRRISFKRTKLAPVLKANAYGHGLTEITKLCADLADLICVYEASELKIVRSHFLGPILLLGPIDPHSVLECLKLEPILSVISIQHLRQLEELGRALNKPINVHLAVDALFGREGILPSELPLLFEVLRSTVYVTVTGVFGHFSCADEPDAEPSIRQLAVFYDVIDALAAKGYKKIDVHMAATSGSLRLRDSTTFKNPFERTSITRLGLGLYGLWPSLFLKDFNKQIALKPVLRWVSWIAQVKEFPAGHPVGYGQTYFTSKNTRLALIPQGYGHGYPRSASNQGWVLIRGTRCYIRGRVSMNALMVDVSHLPLLSTQPLNVGEPVILIGKDGEEEISCEQLAVFEKTINYEIVTKISPLIPRTISSF
jgi:alanine racemase